MTLAVKDITLSTCLGQIKTKLRNLIIRKFDNVGLKKSSITERSISSTDTMFR